ncbi:MAG: hypothetical protein ACOYXT_26850 [Bacteroidota bacterium]
MAFAIASLSVISGCDDDDPKKEDTPELITKAVLTFSPSAGGSPVVVTAKDPDGEGVQDLAVDGPIHLAAAKSYTLTIQLINELAEPTDAEYNITEEVEEEADEHMFFFSWTNNVFNDPTGNGNIDNRSDDVNYEDEDEDGLPLGLETFWTTASASSGKFRVMLKHQPELKSDASTSSTGETDLDIEFTINIQ